MESHKHLITSLLTAPVLVYLLYGFSDLKVALVLILFGTVSGVLIDLDHFLISRWNRGDWMKLKEALYNPLKTFYSPNKVLGDHLGGSVKESERLRTHVLIVLLTAPGLYMIDPGLGYIFLSMTLIHIAEDIYRDRIN